MLACLVVQALYDREHFWWTPCALFSHMLTTQHAHAAPSVSCLSAAGNVALVLTVGRGTSFASGIQGSRTYVPRASLRPRFQAHCACRRSRRGRARSRCAKRARSGRVPSPERKDCASSRRGCFQSAAVSPYDAQRLALELSRAGNSGKHPHSITRAGISRSRLGTLYLIVHDNL